MTRVRRAARAERRRRVAVVATGAVVLAGLAVVPRLAPERRAVPPAIEPADPIARQTASYDIAGDEVVAGSGVVYVRARTRLEVVDPGTGRVTAIGEALLPHGASVPPGSSVVRTVLAGGNLWVAQGGYAIEYLISPSLFRFGGEGQDGQRIDDLVSDDRRIWYAADDRLISIADNHSTEMKLPGSGPTRLAYADGVLWARRQGSDGALLVRIDPGALKVTGTVDLGAGPRGAVIAAGGGRVYAATASVRAGDLTTGGVVSVDARTLAIDERVESAYARDLAYQDGSLWLLAIGGGLHRLDALSLQSLGTPVPVQGRDLAVDGNGVWVAGDRLTRYEAS